MIRLPLRVLGARRAGGLVGVAVAIVLVLSPATPSAAAGSFTATADARLVAVDVTTVPGVLFDQLVDAGYNAAQAQLDSLGQSTAFASNPYPSETVVLLPGLIAGLTAGASSDVVPPYPLIAASSHPIAPDRRVEAGPLLLEASSRADSSRGQATDGTGRSVAEVSFDHDTDTVVARAETSLASIEVSSALTLHGVRSVAEVRQRAGGQLQRSSSFEVAAVTILGQRVALTAGGLAALGQDVPLGIDRGAVLASLVDALAGQGTSIEVVPARSTPDGVVSAGLRITHTSAPPSELAAGVEEVVTAVTLGGSTARVSGRAFPDLVGAVPDLSSPDVVTPTPAEGLRTSGPFPQSTGKAPVGAPAAVPPAPVPAATISSLAADISVAAFYPVLIVAACVLVGVVNLFRHLAVRTP